MHNNLNKKIITKKFLGIETYIYFILFGVGVFILLQSPLAPYAKSTIGIDSSIYIYSAQQILEGHSMYKDIADNKGPFLYLINAMALFFFNGNFIGIWIFEALSLFVASIIMYKTARFFAGKVSSLLAVICSMLPLVICLERGNLTEEWALPYICAGLYIFLDHLKRKKPFTIFRLFILSLTFVLAFMIRANLVAMWAAFGIVLFIKWIFEKDYKTLIRNISFILLFITLSLLPFFLYFYCQGTLSDAVYWIFKFNMFEYPSGVGLLIFLRFTLIRISTIGIIIPLLISVYVFFRDKTVINSSILLAFVFTVLVCSLGHGFWHYYMIFIPLLVIPYSHLLAKIKENIAKRKYIFLLILFAVYNFVFIGILLWVVYNNYSRKDGNALKTEKLTEIIIQNTKPADKILVRGYRTELYLYSNRTCATRFPYTQEWSSFVQKNFVKDAGKVLPKLIIQEKENYFGESFNLDSLLQSRYQLMDTIGSTEIWKLKE